MNQIPINYHWPLFTVQKFNDDTIRKCYQAIVVEFVFIVIGSDLCFFLFKFVFRKRIVSLTIINLDKKFCKIVYNIENEKFIIPNLCLN